MNQAVKDIIFIFGNPIRKVENIANEYALTVIGTNTPSKLIEELKTANDASQFFFIVTDKEELDAVNNMFKRLKGTAYAEPNMFVLIDKKLQSKLKTGKNKVYLKEFAELTEGLIRDCICEVAVNNQIQYFIEVEPEPSPIITKSKMESISKSLNNLEYQNVLQGIKTQFGLIKQNQDNLSVSKLVLETDIDETEEFVFKVETQEFLKQKEIEIKEKLKTVTNKQDLEDLMNILLEIFNMRSDDVKESTKLIIDKMIEEEYDKSRKISEESQTALQEIESTILDGDKKEVEFLVAKRNEYLDKLKTVENEVNERVVAIKDVTVKYLRGIKESSEEVLKGEHKHLLSVESKLAYQRAHKQNGLVIKEKTVELVTVSNQIIQDLQKVVSRYNKLTNLDTSIIESQQRIVDTLSVQKVTENVKYLNPLSAKINLLVTPNPNLGASTLIKIFNFKWDKMLVIDFRETISDPSSFDLLDYHSFMTCNLTKFDSGNVKVNAQMAENVDETKIMKRLNQVESYFDTVMVIVDKYMSMGIDMDSIQRIIYLSDTAEKNLTEVNRIINNYEPLLDNLNKKMLVLNKMTASKKHDLKYLLITAGVDPTKVKVNTMDLSVALVDGDESELKSVSARFNYF